MIKEAHVSSFCFAGNLSIHLCNYFILSNFFFSSGISYRSSHISVFFHWWYRYKKLLCTVDLTKDFFFSYSYNIMCSLQRNLCDGETGQVLYETMFVWNEYLTRGIRNHLKSTMWTVALVYGFFKQVSFNKTDYKVFIVILSGNGYILYILCSDVVAFSCSLLGMFY